MNNNNANNSNNSFYRYTFRDYDGIYYVDENDCYETEDYYTGDAIERLAKYEDSTLLPEQVVLLKNIVDSTFGDTTYVEHIRELLKAEKENRIIIFDKPLDEIPFHIENPCLKCDIGWGKVSENGCISCKDDCERFRQYNEIMGEFKND